MEYQIKGSNLPVLECTLREGEIIICQNGAMSWMTPNMQMETSGGGLGKMMSRLFTGESMFVNKYTPQNGEGAIAFASSMPGSIMALTVNAYSRIICQKRAFLAHTEGVEMSAFINKSIKAGLFGGEGFVMQQFTGEGLVFVEIDGSTVTKELKAGEELVVDTGHVAILEGECTISAKSVGSLKNMALGGEGIFNTVVTGPGKVTLQTMPLSKLTSAVLPYVTR